jgi:NADH-quinone oxidoreductase subunit J
MFILHVILNSFLLISGFLVILSENPVHAVLFLILTFCSASSISILFNAEFLGLLFIIIYVGAIAVLFLFVVMMLNVKVYATRNFYYLPALSTICVILFFQVFSTTSKVFQDQSTVHLDSSFSFLFDSLENIDLLGQSLYNYFLICFLLAGLILLVAMVGAIVLTLNFRSDRKNELVFRQLSRSDKFLFHFK